MSFFKNNFFKKLVYLLLIILFFLLSAFCISNASTVHLPNYKQDILFFSSQSPQDLKLTFVEAIQKAQKKIVLSIFTLKDPHLIAWLNKKAKSGLEVIVYYDKDHNHSLSENLYPSITKIPYQQTGLMHRKLLLIDETLTLLGSANFTRNSLWEDDNLVCGIYHEELTLWLQKHLTHYNVQENFSCLSGNFSCFLTPDKKRQGLEKLIQYIEKAEKKIQIAMYSFTHPEILKALVKAKNKGICVEIFLDKQMQYQNSLKKQKGFNEIKSCIQYGNKPFLLHHKCALIDEKIFIMGSTNWTQAGFLKNQDFIIYFESLNKKQIESLKSIFKKLKVMTS